MKPAQVCEQHKYETFILPLAKQYEWPTELEFETLYTRLQREDVLEGIVALYMNLGNTVLFRTTPIGWKDTRVVKDAVEAVGKVREVAKVCG